MVDGYLSRAVALHRRRLPRVRADRPQKLGMDPSARAPARAGAAGRPAEEAGTSRPAALDLDDSLKQHIIVVLHARDTSYF